MKYLFLILALLVSPVVANDNIVVVLDNSGSMNQSFNGITRMEAAKNALQLVLNNLSDETNVGLITINPVVKTNWIYPIGKIDKNTLSQSIKEIYANGGTPLGAYIKVGADALMELRQKQKYGNYRLLVVTDGEANDENLVEKYVPDIMCRGIRFDVIGVSLKNHTLANKVNSYKSADDQESLTKAVESVLAETPTSDGVSDEYDVINSLSTEMASAIILTYANTPNHEVGTKAVNFVPKVEPSATATAEIETKTSVLTLFVVLTCVFVVLTCVFGFIVFLLLCWLS